MPALRWTDVCPVMLQCTLASSMCRLAARSVVDMLLQGNGSSYIDHSEASGRNGALVEAKADK